MWTATQSPSFTPKNNQGNNSQKERPVINPLNLNAIKNAQGSRRLSSRQASLTHSGLSPSPSARSPTENN